VSETAIRIEHVNKRFGATHAVRDLDLDVPQGSLCGFLGPNGAGKSTTIRMIMSIIYPDSGSIEVLGANALANKDRIGYLPEERGLYRKMRVGEFLEYIARLKGGRRRGASRTVEQWLERIELPDVARKRCQELSKGMQQKIQFLASIIHEPDLLILDEPFSGLDPVNAELINRLIDELRRAGTTIILSTHVLHQAEQICDRIFLINHGVKLLDASLEEIRRAFDPRTIVAEPANGALQVAGIDGVVNVQPIGHGGAVEIMIEEGADPQAIMQTVLSRQPVRRIELRRPTLEDVFVQLVTEDEGAAAAARAREGLGHV
jgi:ABC-2 type transport system ATP-binding protein